MTRNHEHLAANAVGILDDRFGDKVIHFRGIKYATIARRFASPQLLKRSKDERLEATKYGPRCPQPSSDLRELMQIPRHVAMNAPDREHELECCNLNITCPIDAEPGGLPVLLWIYGGAQVVSFPSAAHRLGDTGPLVAQSMQMGRPIILVTVNYRLNIFAYGDGSGQRNLALQDQRAALKWVELHISDFGGNPDNITLAGESAGALYSHALIHTGSRVRRVILASGSLYLGVTKPFEVHQPLVEAITKQAAKIEAPKGRSAPKKRLSEFPAQTLVQAMAELGISNMALQLDDSLTGWEENDEKVFKNLDAVMVGDCEFESVLWLSGVRISSNEALANHFVTQPEEPGRRIALAYLRNRKVSHPKLGMTKSGCLDFIADAHFSYPAHLISQSLRRNHRRQVISDGRQQPQPLQKRPRVFQYVFDEPNPWAAPGSSSARAHHAVDLFAIFGGYDTDIPIRKATTKQATTDAGGMQRVGEDLRKNWIQFVNGDDPWSPDRVYGYGPNGRCGELTDAEYRGQRRRAVEHFQVLEDMGREVYNEIALKVESAAGIVLTQAAKKGKKSIIDNDEDGSQTRGGLKDSRSGSRNKL